MANVENCKSQIERDSAKIHFAQSAKLPSTGKCENYMNEIMATVWFRSHRRALKLYGTK